MTADAVTTRPVDAPPAGTIWTMVDDLLVVDRLDTDGLDARVTFGAWFAGVGDTVHGGAIALLMEATLGRLANTGRPFSRAAYVHVDYRSVTPVDRELTVTARFVRVEGRKRFLRAVVRDGDRVCVEAESLGVQLRPGQP